MLDITVLALTYNEEENVGRSLARLQGFKKIVLLDSFSTDGTCKIASGFPNVELLKHRFETFADQCNYGLTQISSEWVLSIDADYILTDELVAEIRNLADQSDASGYSARFRYCIGGEPLRRTLLPPRTILYRRSKAVYYNEGHGHCVRVDGNIAKLSAYILHDDRKPIRRWFQSQIAYTEVEATHLLSVFALDLSLQDKLRKMIFIAPLIMPVYLLIGLGLVFDGWRGWYYVFQRTIAEMMLSLRLLEAKMAKAAGTSDK